MTMYDYNINPFAQVLNNRKETETIIQFEDEEKKRRNPFAQILKNKEFPEPKETDVLIPAVRESKPSLAGGLSMFNRFAKPDDTLDEFLAPMPDTEGVQDRLAMPGPGHIPQVEPEKETGIDVARENIAGYQQKGDEHLAQGGFGIPGLKGGMLGGEGLEPKRLLNDVVGYAHHALADALGLVQMPAEVVDGMVQAYKESDGTVGGTFEGMAKAAAKMGFEFIKFPAEKIKDIFYGSILGFTAEGAKARERIAKQPISTFFGAMIAGKMAKGRYQKAIVPEDVYKSQHVVGEETRYAPALQAKSNAQIAMLEGKAGKRPTLVETAFDEFKDYVSKISLPPMTNFKNTVKEQFELDKKFLSDEKWNEKYGKMLEDEYSIERLNEKYPKIPSNKIAGYNVGKAGAIANVIPKTLSDYKILPKIREIKMSDIKVKNPNDLFEKAEDIRACEKLAESIKETHDRMGTPTISPIIAAIDANGLRVLAGQRTLGALYLAGSKTIPAVIAKDMKSIYRPKSLPPNLQTNLANQYALDHGIALKLVTSKTARGGAKASVTPSVRQSGAYVGKDFAEYQNFKNINSGMLGGSKDPTRMIQEIDGGVHGGPAQVNILWRTRDMVLHKMRWLDEMKVRLNEFSKGLTAQDKEIANKVIEYISRKGAYVEPRKLLEGTIGDITAEIAKTKIGFALHKAAEKASGGKLSGKHLTEIKIRDMKGVSEKIVKYAQEARKYFEHLLKLQNEMRKSRGQKEIPHREYYTPYDMKAYSMAAKIFGLDTKPEFLMDPKAPMPDYIARAVSQAFNPHAEARKYGMPEFMREQNLGTLLEHYTESAAKDIFNTQIIQNAKAFTTQLKSMGKESSAAAIDDWIAESYAGVRAWADRGTLAKHPKWDHVASWWRNALVRSVFPANFAWNAFVQVSSSVNTYGRYGLRNCVGALTDWLKPEQRAWVAKNAYSYIIKTQKKGWASLQDVSHAKSRTFKLEQSKLETASEALNFFTNWIEKHLTGWSVLAAKRMGEKLGYKGKKLTEFASDGGSKTQSMYNIEDVPGSLRSSAIKTAMPFQTFTFEMWNTMKEIMGKTGVNPAIGVSRAKVILRFVAGMTAVNYISNLAIGRRPWEISSFIPFLGQFAKAQLTGEKLSTRMMPSPMSAVNDLRVGIATFISTGNGKKFRQAAIRYLPGLAGIPGGTAANRYVDGIWAISEGGVKDTGGNMIFPTKTTEDRIKAVFGGPWSTVPGQAELEKRSNKLKVMPEIPVVTDVVENLPIVGEVVGKTTIPSWIKGKTIKGVDLEKIYKDKVKKNGRRAADDWAAQYKPK